jgi:transposase
MSKKQSLKDEADKVVRNIKRANRRKFNSEEKIRIVLAGLRGEESIAELCRQEGIHQNLYYRWSREFMEAGKKRLEGDTLREASTSEVRELRKQNSALKEALAEEILEHRLLKKREILDGEDDI